MKEKKKKKKDSEEYFEYLLWFQGMPPLFETQNVSENEIS